MSVSDVLSKREREVLELLAAGLSYDEIAKQLFISRKTLRNHIHAIYRATGTHAAHQVVSLYYRKQI